MVLISCWFILISGVSSTNAFDAFGGSSAPRVEMTGKAAFGVEDDGFGGDDFSRYGFILDWTF